MNANEFSRLNSYVNILYYAVVMAFTMLFWHPVVLAATFASSLIYNMIIDGRSALKYVFRTILPLYILILLINPLVNHRGVTILFYLNGNMITRESLIFGMLSGLMVVNMMMIFYSFNRVMTSDKLLDVFSVFSKSFALIFTMTLRLLPRYRKEFTRVNATQKGIGEGTGDGGFFDRIRHASEIMNSVITFALEDGIDTANAMNVRGYGLKGKSRYRKSRITLTDRLTALFIILLLAVLVYASLKGCFYINVFPEIKMTLDSASIPAYVLYFISAMMPVVIEIKEAFIWHLSKRKI